MINKGNLENRLLIRGWLKATIDGVALEKIQGVRIITRVELDYEDKSEVLYNL